MKIRLPRWWPIREERLRANIPEPGALIAFENRRVYRIVAVHDISPANWDQEARERYEMVVEAHDPTKRWHQKGPPPRPEEWDERPRAVEVRAVRRGREAGEVQHWSWRPWRSSVGMYRLPEHYAVCVVCGEPYPCTHITSQDEAKWEMEELEPLLTRQPGCCWGCGDPITTRVRKLVSFEGENIDLPTAHTPVVFHLGRRKCREAAYAYDRRWVAADPQRRRSLMSCPGHQVIHLDGSECSEGPACCGESLHHRQGSLDHRLFPSYTEQGPDRCLRCVDALARGAADGPG